MNQQITFTATGKLAKMRLEDVKGERVWFNCAEYEVVGVDDTWDAQGGFKRTITAHELAPSEYSGEYS